MEKKMQRKNTEELSFPGDRKESLKDRLSILIGNRSVRAAAKDWGLSFSTLNNYLTKNTEPSFRAMQTIANKEQVSLDWIAGRKNVQELQVEESASTTSETKKQYERELVQYADDESNYIVRIINMLDHESRKKLLKVLLMKGAETVLLLTNETNLKLMQLSEREKMAMMKLCDNADPEVAKILRQLADLGRGESNDPVTKQAV